MLWNPMVHTSTLPNVFPNLRTLPKIIPFLFKFVLDCGKKVSQYQKWAPLPTSIRCETHKTYLITLLNSGNASDLLTLIYLLTPPILVNCSLTLYIVLDPYLIFIHCRAIAYLNTLQNCTLFFYFLGLYPILIHYRTIPYLNTLLKYFFP